MHEEIEPDKTLDEMDRARRARTTKVVVIVAVIVLFVLFVIQNSNPVPMKFLVFEKSPSLIWVMLGCAIFGGIVGYFVGRPHRPARKPKPDAEGKRKGKGDR